MSRKKKPHPKKKSVRRTGFSRPPKHDQSQLMPNVLFLLITVAILCIAYFSLIKKQDTRTSELDNVITGIIENREYEFSQSYPYGYKIITFENNKALSSSTDTLPEDLEIDWKRIALLHLRPDQTKKNPGAIKIRIPDMHYQSFHISGLEVTTTFVKKRGEVSSIAQFGNREFLMEVLEAYESSLIVLFGLRFKSP